MKYLGIDYGAKRVGIALSDEAGGIAFPYGELPNDEQLLSNVVRLIHEERVTRLVVGDTRSLGGAANPITKEADEFMEKLGKASGMKVTPALEAGSSVEASRYAPEGHEHDNAAAAAFILQRYLDMHEGEGRIGS